MKELKPDQHEPVTLRLKLTYTFEPSECLPDDWEGTREELVEWFRSDMAENFHGWVNRREIYDSIQEEGAAPDLLEALERAENALNWFINDEGECDIEALDTARAAIAKAEGREK
jgi:hypothetical protein